jgi:hypothetical protein
MSDSLKPAYLLTAALSGALFGGGLYISQMIDPLKVLRFLDFGEIPSGGWDPSLGFVIVAAILVMFIGVKISAKKSAPLFNGKFHLPEVKKIDSPLIVGSVLFGIGWAMSGICPGPAISLIAFMPENLLIFLITMFAGSFIGSYILKLMTKNKVDDSWEKSRQAQI